MFNFPIKYGIEIVKDKSGFIKADHKNKKLLISSDIKIKSTQDEKLQLTFQSSKLQKIPLFRAILDDCFDIPYAPDESDCSLIISDPSKFNHCVKRNGIYQLSGSDVTFNGTDGDDTLILSECENSKINMGKGNDTVLYREKRLFNNTIDLGDGNNIFATSYKTDADRALIGNNIKSGNGQDYIYLRNAIGNTVNTGEGNDLVEIEGASQTRFPNYFKGNSINTEAGDDTVNILGKYDIFSNNIFCLGKGNDTFSAEINPNYDASTEYDYNNNLTKYIAVSDNEVYATDGKKGWFEKDAFESKTYSANKFILSGFEPENVTTKPIPKDIVKEDSQTEVPKSPKKLTREDYSRIYSLGSLRWNLFRDPKGLEMAFKACDNYVNSMNK